MSKKIIYITIGLIASAWIHVNAQNLKYGFIIGLDVSNARMTNKPESERNSRSFYPILAFNVNGFLKYTSSTNWGLSAEPGFIQKGGRLKDDENYDGEDQIIRGTYIQLPIMFDLYFTDALYISVGPEISYLLNASLKSGEYSDNINSLYDNKFELSALIGVNYSITDHLDIGLRYSHALTVGLQVPYFDEFGNYIGDVKQYNQYVQLLFQIKI